MKKVEINLIKSFMNLQENITKEKEKLYNNFHHMELSHNRKIKALQKIKTLTENYLTPSDSDQEFLKEIHKICENALLSNGRERGYV